MYRVLLVDDEIYIVDGLFSFLHAHLADKVEIIKAYDGAHALKCASGARMDLVISDINMPGTDGFTLLKEFTRYWPGCGFIFLTGHASFDYAYRALKHGNVKFLLKSEGSEAVLNAVKETLEKLEAERMALAPTYAARCDSVFGPFINNVINEGKTCTPPDGFRLSDHALLVAARIDYAAQGAEDQATLLFHMESSAQHFFQSPVAAFSWKVNESMIAWVIQPENPIARQDEPEQSRMLRFCQGMTEALQTFFLEGYRCGLSFAMTDDWISLRELAYTLTLAEYILKDRENTDSKSGPQIFKLPCRFLNEITDDNDLDIFKSILEGLYLGDAEKLEARITNKNLRESLMHMLVDFGTHNRVDGLSAEALSRFTIDEMLLHARHVIIAASNRQKDDPGDRLITSIHAYVESHLDSQLTLTEIAEHIHMNPSYLSRYYKKQQNENLFDYIQKKRISRAKKLLIQKRTKVSDVALAVGFNSIGYFSLVFRKAVGVSPQDYRRTAQDRAEVKKS